MKQDRKPRNTHALMGTLFWQRKQEYTMGAKTASAINGAGETGQLHVKEQNWTLPNTINKDKLKMD